jgi:hypothetical protein
MPDMFRREVMIDASALSDARFRCGVRWGELLLESPVEPFGRGRPWLRGGRALCKFNGEKVRY